jgi:Holliday junction resolvase RusA-like endonuclease
MTVLNLPFPPSLNNMFINSKHGRFRSQKYDSWIMEAGNEILRQRPSKVAGPVILSFEFQDGHDKRRRDISNLIKAPEDLLVSHRLIEADDQFTVRKISASWATDVEGVRVTIEPFFSIHRVSEMTKEAAEG